MLYKTRRLKVFNRGSVSSLNRWFSCCNRQSSSVGCLIFEASSLFRVRADHRKPLGSHILEQHIFLYTVECVCRTVPHFQRIYHTRAQSTQTCNTRFGLKDWTWNYGCSMEPVMLDSGVFVHKETIYVYQDPTRRLPRNRRYLQLFLRIRIFSFFSLPFPLNFKLGY